MGDDGPVFVCVPCRAFSVMEILRMTNFREWRAFAQFWWWLRASHSLFNSTSSMPFRALTLLGVCVYVGADASASTSEWNARVLARCLINWMRLYCRGSSVEEEEEGEKKTKNDLPMYCRPSSPKAVRFEHEHHHNIVYLDNYYN